MKKKILLMLTIILTGSFGVNVYAQQYTDINVYGSLNGTKIYEDDNMDNFTKINNSKSLNANIEPKIRISIEDYLETNSASKNYILVVNYCSTAYPSLSNAVTNGYDLTNAILLENYSINNAGTSCKIGDYFGNMYQGVFAITRNFAGTNPNSFSITIWGGHTFDYVTWYQINSIALYDYTEELANSYKSLKVQNENKNSIDNQTNIINQDHTYNNNPSENIQGQNEIDNMTNAEDNLMNSLDFSGANDINVSINPNSSNFIWKTINRLREINPAIITLITSISGIGIFKLILNR